MSPTRKALSTSERTSLIIASVGIITLASLLAVVLMKTQPRSQRSAPSTGAPIVETTLLEAVDHQVELPILGLLAPSVDVTLQARVAGEVLDRSPEFIPGAHVQRGDTLLLIDPSDFAVALEASLAQREQAQVALLSEEGRQRIALAEWELLGGDSNSVDQRSRDLVLRRPQLKSARAALRSAEAAVRQAELNLSRCVITAAMDAVVLAANVDAGDVVGPQTILGRLAGSGSWWTHASLPIDQLEWIEFPARGQTGSSVLLHSSTGARLEGHVLKLEAAVESGGRLARLLIELPRALAQAEEQGAPLLLGDFVEGTIHGRVVRDVHAVKREFLRDANTLWWMDGEDRLRIQAANILLDGESELLIPARKDGWNLVSSSLGSAVEGMQLRRAEARLSRTTSEGTGQ